MGPVREKHLHIKSVLTGTPMDKKAPKCLIFYGKGESGFGNATV